VSDIKEVVCQLSERGIGVLITDHNVRETLDICEKAYIVNEGNIIAAGTAQQILENKLVKAVYLGQNFRM
jgi:lipopolysaccharide export system ATP-binding protein